MNRSLSRVRRRLPDILDTPDIGMRKHLRWPVGIAACSAAGIAAAGVSDLQEFVPGLVEGALVTAQIFLAGSIVAIFMAFVAALAKMYGIGPVRWVATAYIEVFRGTSAVVQLFWVFFVFPHFGLTLEPLTVAIGTLGLNIGAYGAEVVRGAFRAVPRDQWEAATALNIRRVDTIRHIILPQAILAMIPPWGNLLIELLKSTSLVSFITIADLSFRAQLMNQVTFRTAEIFFLVLLFYVTFAAVITSLVRVFEQAVIQRFGRAGG